MKTSIILISLMLGLQLIVGNAQAEKKPVRDASDKQQASKPVAGTLWIEPRTRMKFVWGAVGLFLDGRGWE